jgi:hypothetical protein
MSTRGHGRGRAAAAAGAGAGAGAAEEPKRKGAAKKKFSVVAVVTPDTIEGSLQPETRKPLIAHLPIHSCDITFHDAPIAYNPVPPSNVEPYDALADDPFVEGAETWNSSAMTPVIAGAAVTENGKGVRATTSAAAPAAAVAPAAAPVAVTHETVEPDYTKKTTTLLVQFEADQEVRKLPERTDVACFWCCHTFDTSPVVLPLRDQGEYLQVIGNFCSPECAMSYLFDMRQDSYARWEQLSLLNRLYADAVGGRIRPAPSRQVLKMFGGPMTIEEYRSFVRKGKMRVDVHVPPLVSLLSTMDTKPIDFYDTSLTKNVMETVKERLAKAEEVLKLKRTKPLKAWDSTLDACINLRVRPAS